MFFFSIYTCFCMFWLNSLINDCFDFTIHYLLAMGYVLTSILFHQVVFCVFVYYIEYTDAQVGDAGGLFMSDLCGAVPVYLVQCCSSNLPRLVLQFQSTSSYIVLRFYAVCLMIMLVLSLILLCAVLVNVIHLLK